MVIGMKGCGVMSIIPIAIIMTITPTTRTKMAGELEMEILESGLGSKNLKISK